VSESELQPGEIVAEKFSIVEPIGVGGSATVYRAQRVGMSQEVALKLMHAEHPDSDNEKIRFAREAELVMKLKHPHVVPLLDYGHTEDGVPFLVFAMLEGQSLEQKVRSDGSMAWAQMGRLSVQILKALERAHSLGVVHRDIKPANIFVCSGVLGEVAQVLDFGLAKMVKEPDTDLTQAGALLGTPRYMAPEQVRGETITHAADIYSFGLVMAEMLLGRPLVTGAKELDIYVAQGSDKPIFVPDEVLSTPFGNIIQRAVDKKVEVRYHMASQMLADVQAVLENIEGPQDDIEADLDATRMIDPSMAAVLSNPHAEKMRRVLNAAANKKAAETAKSQPSTPASATAERPTRVPPGMQSATAPLDDIGPPPPIPAAAYDNEPIVSSGVVSSDPMGVMSSVPMSGPISSDPSPSGTLPISHQVRPPMPSGPISSSGAVMPPSAPVSEGGHRLGRADDLGLPVPQARPRQTGLVIALLLVMLLIVAGVGAIVWMLGLVPI
jgi:serine/threonine-protein kinase